MSASPAPNPRPSLTIKRRIKAAPAKVFAAWTQPQALAQWFGPEQIREAQADIDARVGGRFQVVMNANDGERHEVRGVYREVVPNEKLIFTWSWISTPEPDGDATLLTLTHEQLFDETTRDGHSRGWIGSLDKLEQFFAAR
jgi:uncharacterized protein YndB with AHSA1/START domain